MTPIEYFEAGELDQAVESALEDVRSNPTDLEKRMVLCQMLCFSGDLERADKQLDLLSTQSSDIAAGLTEFRQLIRSEQSRREFYSAGRVPEFLGEPTAAQQLQLKASIFIREGDGVKAMEMLNEAAELVPEIKGTCNESEFVGFRDLDDLLGTTIEVLTNNGKYYWVPAERIRELTFHPVELYHQLLWRRADIHVEDGPEGVVHVPVTYANINVDADAQAKLGRMTDWSEMENGPTLGIGQRTWLIGDDDIPLMSIQTFSASVAE